MYSLCTSIGILLWIKLLLLHNKPRYLLFCIFARAINTYVLVGWKNNTHISHVPGLMRKVKFDHLLSFDIIITFTSDNTGNVFRKICYEIILKYLNSKKNIYQMSSFNQCLAQVASLYNQYKNNPTRSSFH
jgi:hypothetical protein